MEAARDGNVLDGGWRGQLFFPDRILDFGTRSGVNDGEGVDSDRSVSGELVGD